MVGGHLSGQRPPRPPLQVHWSPFDDHTALLYGPDTMETRSSSATVTWHDEGSPWALPRAWRHRVRADVAAGAEQLVAAFIDAGTQHGDHALAASIRLVSSRTHGRSARANPEARDMPDSWPASANCSEGRSWPSTCTPTVRDSMR